MNIYFKSTPLQIGNAVYYHRTDICTFFAHKILGGVGELTFKYFNSIPGCAEKGGMYTSDGGKVELGIPLAKIGGIVDYLCDDLGVRGRYRFYSMPASAISKLAFDCLRTRMEECDPSDGVARFVSPSATSASSSSSASASSPTAGTATASSSSSAGGAIGVN